MKEWLRGFWTGRAVASDYEKAVAELGMELALEAVRVRDRGGQPVMRWTTEAGDFRVWVIVERR